MNKEKRRVPKLRFPGFTEDWEQRKLGEFVKIVSGDAPSTFISGNCIYVKVDDLNYSDRIQLSSSNLVNANSKAHLVNQGATIFPKRGAAIMTNKVRIMGKDGYLDTNMMALIPEEIDKDFLFTFIQKTGLYKIADTSTIPQINNKHIEPYIIQVPSEKEQAYIGVVFEKIDKIITLHQRKLEHLNLKKKALLQKLFPKNGERHPELRFPGFTDAWEQRKLGDYLSIPEKEILEVKSANDLLTVKLNLGGVELGASRDTLSLGSTVYYKRYAGQFIYGKQNFFNGSMGIIPQKLDGKGSSGDVPSFNISNIEANYLYAYVSRESYWRPKVAAASGTGSKRIHEKTLLDFNIDIPSINEQKLISNTFDLINRFITLHQRKLEHLQLQKKALLQQMFV